MPVNSVGIVTARDGFVIDMDRAALKRRIETFRNPDLTDEMVTKALGLKDNRDWKLKGKRRSLQDDKDWETKLTKILYRPFDERHILYHRDAIDFGREEVMGHMVRGDNLALIIMRQVSLDEAFTHVLATSQIVDNRTFVSSKGITTVQPLYLYPETKQPEKKKPRGSRFSHMMLFEPEAPYGGKMPNLNPDIMMSLTTAYGKAPSPENVFYYLYAILYSPPYRERYREFIKSDFPRIPFTADAAVFRKMAAIGEKLVALHLLKSPELDRPSTRFNTPGDNRVAKNAAAGRRYDADTQRLYINKTQYFDNILSELWDTRIGGYQVLDKWLKDRADRHLTPADVKHYCRTATALATTLQLQQNLTALYPKVEAETVGGSWSVK